MHKVLLALALGLGGLITYVDTRPNWDDTGVTAMAIFLSCGLLGAVGPRRPWLWALAVGIWIPVLGIAVTGNYRVHFHGFAVGVQIYTWDGVSWGRAVPEATLFDAEGNVVAIHFAGPTWESNSGSKVLGAVVQPTVTVDPNAIPWVKLKAVSTEGPGIFAGTTFIQRVNTSGGKAPSADGTFVGQVARVPYTADYFFYRQTND